MNKRYKIIIVIFSAIILLTLIYFIVNYSSPTINNKNLKKQSLIYTLNDISVNYINGDELNITRLKAATNFENNFSVTNNGSAENYYTISLINIDSNIDDYKKLMVVIKKINDITNNEITISGSVDQTIINHIKISSGETQRYKFKISCYECQKEDYLKAKLNISLATQKESYFADTIIQNNPPQSFTSSYTEVAINNEGLIFTKDDFGIAYIFRGNIQNNYANFADMTWRIVGINGNGTIRLVLDGIIPGSSEVFNNKPLLADEVDISLADFEKANINKYLKRWYETNLIDVASTIANTKFCLDLSAPIIDNNNQYFKPYSRININNDPSLQCQETSIVQKIGLLTVDELIMSGAVLNKPNNNFYLNNPNIFQSWSTLSPLMYDKQTKNIYIYTVQVDGSINTDNRIDNFLAVRPVISLNNNLLVTGTGISIDPYKVIIPDEVVKNIVNSKIHIYKEPNKC